MASLSALLPLTYLLSSNQQVEAFSSASTSSLVNTCSDQNEMIRAMEVTVNNSNTKLVLSTLAGITTTDISMVLELRLPGDSLVDAAFLTSDGVSGQWDTAALSWTGTSSGTYKVNFQNLEVGAVVCLNESSSDMRVIY